MDTAVQALTVKDLIAHLQSFSPDLPVAYALFSEWRVLQAEEVGVCRLQPARPDGWVHEKWCGEPEVVTIEYLVFP